MPHSAMSCSPVVSGDPSMPDQVVDFSVDANRPFVDPNNLYTTDAYGNTTYNAPEDPTQQMSDGGFDMGTYMADLMAANPTIKEAFDWGENNLPDETINEFNQIIQAADLEQLHKGIEWLTQQFNEYGGMTQEMDDEPIAEDFSDDEVASIEDSYPVEELQDYLIANYDKDTIAQFDAIVEQGSFEQVKELYNTLYQDYLEA